jgi:hypothetical protein
MNILASANTGIPTNSWLGESSREDLPDRPPFLPTDPATVARSTSWPFLISLVGVATNLVVEPCQDFRIHARACQVIPGLRSSIIMTDIATRQFKGTATPIRTEAEKILGDPTARVRRSCRTARACRRNRALPRKCRRGPRRRRLPVPRACCDTQPTAS